MKKHHLWTGLAVTLLALLPLLAMPATAEEGGSCGDAGAVTSDPDGGEVPEWLVDAVAVGDVEIVVMDGMRVATQQFAYVAADGALLPAGELRCESECKNSEKCKVDGCLPDKVAKTCSSCTCKDQPGKKCTSSACKYCRKIASIAVNF